MIFVLALQNKVDRANGLTLREGIILDNVAWSVSTTPTSAILPKEEPLDMSMIHVVSSSVLWLFGLIFLVLIGMVLRIIWCYYLARIRVDLLIYGARESCMIRLLTLPGLRQVNLDGTNILGEVTLEKRHRVLPYVNLRWMDIKVDINGISIILPSKYLIWPGTFSSLSKIITKPFAAILLIKQGSVLLGHVGHMPENFTPPDIEMGITCMYYGSRLKLIPLVSKHSRVLKEWPINQDDRVGRHPLKRSRSFSGHGAT